MKSMKWFGLGILMIVAEMKVNGWTIPLVPLGYLVLLLETREKFGRGKQISLQIVCLAGVVFSAAEWYMQIWAAQPWGDWTDLVQRMLRLVLTFLLGRAVSTLTDPGPQTRRLWRNWAVMAAGNLVIVLVTLAIQARLLPEGQVRLEQLRMGAGVLELVFLVCYLLSLGRAYRLRLEQPARKGANL